jgi:hypothetical protein
MSAQEPKTIYASTWAPAQGVGLMFGRARELEDVIHEFSNLTSQQMPAINRQLQDKKIGSALPWKRNSRGTWGSGLRPGGVATPKT